MWVSFTVRFTWWVQVGLIHCEVYLVRLIHCEVYLLGLIHCEVYLLGHFLVLPVINLGKVMFCLD
jgi:hypothetical protein